MKFLFSTDGHLSPYKPIARKEKTDEEYIDTQLKKRKQMYEYGKANEIENFINGGDFFNAWNPKSLPSLLNKFLKLRVEYLINEYVNIGNHDLKYHQLKFLKDSALGTLESIWLVWIKKEHLFVGKDFEVKLHFFHFGQDLDKRELLEDGFNVAVIHENIFEKQVPPYMDGYTVKELRKKLPGYDLYLCGHNHQKFVVKNKDYTVVNGGSVMRLNTKQKDFKPAFWEIEFTKNNFTVKEIPFKIEPNMISTEHLKKNKMESFVESTQEFEELDGFDFRKDVEVAIKKDKPSEQIKNRIYKSMEDTK